MIVKWTKPNAGLKILHARSTKNKDQSVVSGKGMVILQPGANEVDDELWKIARESLSHDPEKNFIIEVVAKEIVEKLPEGMKESEAKKTPDGKYEITGGKSISSLDKNQALELISDTWNLETLKKWRKESSSEELRTAIANQIEEVEKG